MKKVIVVLCLILIMSAATVAGAECWPYRYYGCRYYDYDYRYYNYDYCNGYYGGYTQLDGVIAGIALGRMVSETVDRALAPVTAQQAAETTIWRETPDKRYWEKKGQRTTIGKSLPPWIGQPKP